MAVAILKSSFVIGVFFRQDSMMSFFFCFLLVCLCFSLSFLSALLVCLFWKSLYLKDFGVDPEWR